jgi:hypothetical protein
MDLATLPNEAAMDELHAAVLAVIQDSWWAT